jgi:hypothetical protein
MFRSVRSVGLIAVATAVLGTACGKTPEERKKWTVWRYPNARMETFAESKDDHEEKVFRVWEADRHGLAEDLDLFFQTDRNSRLTKWHDR